MRKKFIFVFLVLVFLTTALTACKSGENEKITSVSNDNKALKFFKESKPAKKVILSTEEDINGDGKKDLVIIYEKDEKNNFLVVVINNGDKYETTNEVPAPVSNQKIDFKDIDKKSPTEFMVSGSKGSNFGYAIFRVEGTKLKDIFGDGMEKCCR